MAPATNQILPRELSASLSHTPVVYNLTFDYDFARVPRDLGETQLRIDFSNQENYWDEVVAAAASKRKSKRQLTDKEYGGNHRRWLEDEFRDDYHGGLSNREQLHKRWFGQDILEWLSQMLKPSISREFRHEIKDDYIIKILDDEVHCGEGDAQFDAYIRATATTSVEVSTSFGMTLTAVFTADRNKPIDITGSYVTFFNEGHISAILSLETLASVHYSKKGRIANIPFPGASFSIAGITTIGPQLNIYGEVDVSLTASAEFETTVDIASWEIRQTLPDTNSDNNPKELDKADYDDTGSWNGIQKPKVYAGILATGDASAHLLSSVDFGITFDPKWKVDDARASVVADGWIMVKMGAGKSTVTDCPFTYGVKVGADMYAEVKAPSIFGWEGTMFDLPGPGKKTLIDGGTCPDLKAGDPLRGRDTLLDSSDWMNVTPRSHSLGDLQLIAPARQLSKRAEPWGPAFHIPLQKIICPIDDDELGDDPEECEQSGWEDDEMNSDSLLEKRDRVTPRRKSFCDGNGVITYQAPAYHSSSSLQTDCPTCAKYGYAKPGDCLDFTFSTLDVIQDTSRYQTEHVLEMQLLTDFFEWVRTTEKAGNNFPNPQIDRSPSQVGFCNYMKGFWYQVSTNNRVSVDGSMPQDPIELVAQVWPGTDNQWKTEFMLLDKGVNRCKGDMWGTSAIRTDNTMQGYVNNKRQKAFQNLKDCMMALAYMKHPTVNNTLVEEKNRVGDRLAVLDNDAVPGIVRTGYRNWESQGLAGLWNTFMSQRAREARTKVETHINRWLRVLNETYADPAQGTSPVAEANRRFIEKIDVLAQNWKDFAKWVPPFGDPDA